MIKRYYTVGDFVDDMFRGIESIYPVKSYSFQGEFIDTSKYDVILKKEFVEKEIARKEEELRQVEIRHRQHEERLREEISVLKDQRKRREKTG